MHEGHTGYWDAAAESGGHGGDDLRRYSDYSDPGDDRCSSQMIYEVNPELISNQPSNSSPSSTTSPRQVDAYPVLGLHSHTTGLVRLSQKGVADHWIMGVILNMFLPMNRIFYT